MHTPDEEKANSLTDGAILHQAAEQDNVPMIDFLVGEAGIDVNFRGDRGLTPLHSAALRGRDGFNWRRNRWSDEAFNLKGASQAMTALVKHGADASALDENSLTPLHHAATGGDPAAIDVLCSAGVDVNLRVDQDFSYPPECDTWSALDFAAIDDNVDAFKALVRRGADWKALSSEGLTVLNTAAASSKTEVIDALIELGAPVDGPRGVENTPLFTATASNSPDAARALLRHGANVHGKPEASDDDSPLYHAVMWGHCGAGVVNALIEKGADPNDVADGTESALEIMFLLSGTVDVLEAFLRGGAEVIEPLSTGNHLLHEAVARYDGARAVELLVEAGADVHAVSPRGLTPLQMACAKPDGSAVAALMRHGAAVDVVDGEGNSLLHLAAVAEGSRWCMSSWGQEEPPSSVDVLLRAGADETATNDNDHTPHDRVRLELADSNSHSHEPQSVLRLLERAPNDRAWRRRALWALCRAHPERVHVELEANGPEVREIDGGDAAVSEDVREESGDPMDVEGAGDLSRVLARVLGLHEEGIFRTIVGFL